MNPTSRPYVVSLDLELQLDKWGKRTGFSALNTQLLSEIRHKNFSVLSSIFPEVTFLDGIALQDKIKDFLILVELPVITVDSVYTESEFSLDLTRAITHDLKPAGTTHRAGSKCPSEQYSDLSKLIQGPVTILDDVVFSGDTIANNIIPELKLHGIEVKQIVTGIGIAKGVKKIKQQVKDVTCVYYFNEVHDEVCERDFFPGIDQCGRTILNNETIGAPYLLPFGKPQDWASIPEKDCLRFSRHCLEMSQIIFEDIGNRSGRPVLYSDISRKINTTVGEDEIFTDALQRIRMGL